MTFKIGVLKNFAQLTGKHLCQSLFLTKLEAPPATLLKRDPGTGMLLAPGFEKVTAGRP